jgi:hypothetical protein
MGMIRLLGVYLLLVTVGTGAWLAVCIAFNILKWIWDKLKD